MRIPHAAVSAAIAIAVVSTAPIPPINLELSLGLPKAAGSAAANAVESTSSTRSGSYGLQTKDLLGKLTTPDVLTLKRPRSEISHSMPGSKVRKLNLNLSMSQPGAHEPSGSDMLRPSPHGVVPAKPTSPPPDTGVKHAAGDDTTSGVIPHDVRLPHQPAPSDAQALTFAVGPSSKALMDDTVRSHIFLEAQRKYKSTKKAANYWRDKALEAAEAEHAPRLRHAQKKQEEWELQVDIALINLRKAKALPSTAVDNFRRRGSEYARKNRALKSGAGAADNA